MPARPTPRDVRTGPADDHRKAAPGHPTNVPTGTAVNAPDLPLPHERDEMSRDTPAPIDPNVAQAKRDLDAGMVDTDLRATPGLDAGRRRELLRRPSR